MLRNIWNFIKLLISFILLFMMIVLPIIIFFSPIWLMFIYNWTTGFLFIISWIPAISVGVIISNLINILRKI